LIVTSRSAKKDFAEVVPQTFGPVTLLSPSTPTSPEQESDLGAAEADEGDDAAVDDREDHEEPLQEADHGIEVN
jgi:hypothetical protein